MDLIIVVLASLLAVPLTLLTTGLFRAVVGLVLVLFSPGYLMTIALFPKAADLGGLARLALSFGISIAAVPLIGLLLNFTPWGVQLNPLLLSLVIFNVGMAAIAWSQRRRFPSDVAYKLFRHVQVLRPHWVPHGGKSIIWAGLMLVFVIGTSFAVSRIAMKPPAGETFTELYVLGLDRKTDRLPDAVSVGSEVRVVVGILNRESGPATYSLVVTIERQKIEEIGPIMLDVGGHWEQEVAFVTETAGTSQLVECTVYRDGSREPYREVHFWMDVVRSM